MDSNDSDLEELPTEILGKVMESLDSTHDLHAMIRSSPRFLRIFLHSPEKMLFSVLQQFLGPEAMYHGIAAIKVPQLPLHVYPSENKMQQELLDRYLAHDDQISENFATNRGDLVELVRITSQVRFCIEHYANTTLSELDAAIEKLDPLRYLTSTESIIRSFLVNGGTNNRSDINGTTKVYSLSTAELERLQRAFFRFELFHRLHYSTQESFTLKLQPWEVLEIVTICDYFYARMNYLFKELEKEIRGKIWAALGLHNMDVHLRVPPTTGRAEAYGWTHLEPARTDLLVLVRKSLPEDADILHELQYSRLLPTKCLAEFLRGDTTTLLEFIRKCHTYCSGVYPRISFGVSHWNSNGSWRMDTRTGPHVANLGYKLWNLPDVHQGDLQMLRHVHFEQATLGHVFWDTSRIGHGSAFLAIDEAISERVSSPDYDMRFTDAVENFLRPTTVKVPGKLLDDIFKEYGLVPIRKDFRSRPTRNWG